MRQVKNVNSPVASGLCVVKVAAVSGVFLGIANPVDVVVVLLQHEVLDALNFVFLGDFKNLHCELFASKRIFLLIPLHLHRKGVNVLAVGGEGSRTHPSAGALLLLFGFLLLRLLYFLVFFLLG